MKNYWKIYSITLLAYIFFNILWIDARNGLENDIKIVATSGCMIFLFIAGIIAVKSDGAKLWCVILLIPISIIFWATMVDFFIGLAFHGNPFYLSNTWPDSKIIKVVQNGQLYAIFKLIAMIVCATLTYYITINKKS